MIDLLVDALAVHRLTRLVTTDTLTRGPREELIAAAYGEWVDPKQPPGTWERQVELDDDAPKLAKLLTCRWCASVWVALAVACVRRTRAWRTLRYALALSSASTLLAGAEPH